MAVFAAKKHAILAAASVAAVGFVTVGSAGGAANAKRHDPQAPSEATNIRVISLTPTSVSIAWDASTDNVGVVGYQVVVDGTRKRVDGTRYTVNRRRCGASAGVWIEAFDRAGNRSRRVGAVVSTAACADLEAPTPPSGFQQAATTQDAVVLVWNASEDNTGVVSYGVYRAGLLVASTPQPATTLQGLSCSSVYEYAVDAVDAAGNRSSRRSAWVQTTDCPDEQPPSSPTGLAVGARTASSISLSWSASSDNVGVIGYGVSVDADSALTVTEPGATIQNLTCGKTYAVGVDAADAAGNRSQAATISASTAACSSPPPPPPPPGSGDTAPPSTPAGLAASSVTQTSLTFTWNAASDNVGVTGYDVYRDNTKLATVTATSSNQTGLTCGTSYILAVEAFDAAGNHSPRAQLNATTAACSAPPPPPPPPGDTTPPSQPASLALQAANQTSVTLIWAPSTDNVGVAGYGVYRSGTIVSSPSQPGATVSGLTCGTAYAFEVDAFDAAGNRSSRAAVTVSTAACADTQPPTAPTNVTASSRTATSIALSWSPSSDNVGVVGYGLYQAGAAAGTSAGTTGIFSGLTCNTNYTLAVDAYDAAGNRSSKTTVMVATTACPDTTPPSAPTGVAVSNVTQTSLTLAWSASSDNVGVAGYDVYRNNTKMATVTSTSSNQTGLACGSSYSLAVEAFDAAGNRSTRAQLNATTAACPPPSPPPPAGCVVDPATMTAPGCIALRDDTGVQADPVPALWGEIAAVSAARVAHVTSGGDSRPKANGSPQGNTAFRRLTVQDGDDFYGERAELGRNEYRYGENTGTQTSGTFALYREGERKITFFSQRYGAGFNPNLGNWQTVFQMKQAQPYAGNGPVDSSPALELQIYGGRVRLHSFWNSIWTTPAPPLNSWIRYAFDVTYSQDPAKGKIQLFVDSNANGDFLDPGEVSPVLTMRTLAYVTSQGSGTIPVGGSIPGHLRLGIYHHSVYGTTTVDVDNVQIVSG